MSRLDKERQERLEPVRIQRAVNALKKLGLEPTEVTSTHVAFLYKGQRVTYFAYSGWATGRTITDCRGLSNLLKQLV